MAYSYKIGTTLLGLVNLEILEVVAPKSTYKEATTMVTLGNGRSKRLGFPEAEWHWDYLDIDQRNALKAYFTAQSEALFIATRTNEDVGSDQQDDYADFACVAHWPEEEEKSVQFRFDFNLRFTNLVAQ